MSVLFLQHGDYAAAWRRMQAGEAETYRDQYRSVRFVADLAAEGPVTTVAICERPHDEELAPGLRSVGVLRRDLDRTRVAALLDDVAPTRFICRTPHGPALTLAARRKLPTLPCFADMMARPGLRGLPRHIALRRALAADTVPCVANHSLNASRSLLAAGLARPDRIVPWDWSRLDPDPDPKTGPADPAALHLFFAGKMSADKGLGDAIEAVASLRAGGLAATLSVAGGGDPAPWRDRAKQAGATDAVTFLGLIPNTDVRRHMAAHDVVIVPSRHDYPEGLPNTIYEGLASRSALVLSDHPAFMGRVEPGEAALVFRAGDPDALAGTLRRLAGDPGLYARLSQQAPAALDRLYVGLEWDDLVRRFLDDPGNDGGWVAPASLAAQGLA